MKVWNIFFSADNVEQRGCVATNYMIKSGQKQERKELLI